MRKILCRSDQAFGREKTKQVTMKFIAATLRDDIEYAACRLAVLGAVCACLNLDLLHELEWEICSRTTECRVRSVDPVENVIVFRTRRAADRRINWTTR